MKTQSSRVFKKLYECERGTKFQVHEQAQTPPDCLPAENNVVYRLRNIDGMYSYCTDIEGNVVHIAAFTDVEVLDEKVTC